MDIADKHHLLLPVWGYASVLGVEFEDNAGHVEGGNTPGFQDDTFSLTVPIPESFHVKEHGRVAVEVMLEDRSLTEDAEVTSTLRDFGQMTLKVIELLEQITHTL